MLFNIQTTNINGCEEVDVEISDEHVDHFSLILLFTMSHNPYYFRLEGHEDGRAQLVSMV